MSYRCRRDRVIVTLGNLLVALLLSTGLAACRSRTSNVSHEKKNDAAKEVERTSSECTPSCTPPESYSLTPPVTLVSQECDSWCWAASGQMIMNYPLGSVTQCDEANKRLNRKDCCSQPTPGDCDKGGFPQPNRYNFNFCQTHNKELQWDELKKQIGCKKQPFAFSWHKGGGGHMMVAIGYSTNNTSRYLEIYNPDSTALTQYYPTWAYEAYVHGSDYTHWDDFYNLTKK